MNLAMRALKGQSKPRMSLIRIFNASTWPHEWTRNKFITLILINDPIWTRICSHSLAATGYLNWAKNISSRKVVHRPSPFCTSKIVFIHHSSEFEVHMEAQSENEGGMIFNLVFHLNRHWWAKFEIKSEFYAGATDYGGGRERRDGQ